MINKVILVGNLGKDAELRYSNNELAIATASLATSRKVKGESTTEWHRLVAFGNTAEFLGKLLKGALIYVEGRIQTRDYTDNNGVKRYVTEIVVETYRTLSKSEPNPAEVYRTNTPQSAGDMVREAAAAIRQSKGDFEDDDIPF